jgi:hypothetical protein
MARTDFGALDTSRERLDSRTVRMLAVGSFHRMRFGRMRNPVFLEERSRGSRVIVPWQPRKGSARNMSSRQRSHFRRFEAHCPAGALSLRASGGYGVRASVPQGTHLRHWQFAAWTILSGGSILPYCAGASLQCPRRTSPRYSVAVGKRVFRKEPLWIDSELRGLAPLSSRKAARFHEYQVLGPMCSELIAK